jgi:hypothetical protein
MMCDRATPEWYARRAPAAYQPSLDEMLTEGGPHYDAETVAFIDAVIAAVKADGVEKSIEETSTIARKAAAETGEYSIRPALRIWPEGVSAKDIADQLHDEGVPRREIGVTLYALDRFKVPVIADALGISTSAAGYYRRQLIVDCASDEALRKIVPQKLFHKRTHSQAAVNRYAQQNAVIAEAVAAKEAEGEA